ncbi:MAG: MFS transporter [Anaerolineaceae bacterium]|nr:MFS transporter [Anaerolineaceae bacterium]
MLSRVSAPDSSSSWRFVILALCVLTPFGTVTMPNMSLPPMFGIISEELGLSLVEIGGIWGMVGFSGVFFAIIGGTIGDRLGARNMLFLICLFSGIFGLLRALATDFVSLLLFSMLYGFAQGSVPVMVFKAMRQWIPGKNLGMASGIISAGFAGGLMLGPLLSTSVILPALGGWRQVLVLYGLLAIAISVLWLLLHPAGRHAGGEDGGAVSVLAGLRAAARIRNLWLMGIGGLGIGACFSGFSGYLPTYLKAVGWAPLDADRALALFFLASLVCVVPISTLSDRLRIRRGFLVALALLLGLGVGALGLVAGALVLLVAVVTGSSFDSVMALQQTSVMEVEGVDNSLSGSALGMVTTIRNLGIAFAPPLGNSLAIYSAGLPFLFWGACGVCAALVFSVAYNPPRRATA